MNLTSPSRSMPAHSLSFSFGFLNPHCEAASHRTPPSLIPSDASSTSAPQSNRAENTSASAPAPSGEWIASSERRILVVDSDESTRRDLRFLFRGRGHEVFESSCREEAFTKVEACQPDLILLGTNDNDKGGFETCRRFKAIASLAEVPVIFLISGSDTWNAAEGFLAGASDYIAKPIRVREAVSRIEKHLNIRSLLQARNHQITQLDSLNRSKDRIMRMASHDLRSSLSAIGDLAEMLETGGCGPLNAEQKEVLGWITAAAGNVTELLGDLHAISSIEAGTALTPFTRQPLVDVAQTVVRLAQGTAAKKQLGVALSLGSDLKPLLFDRNQIRRVIENFVSNAMKFSPAGGTVRVKISQSAREARVEVHDEGPGVREDEQSRLFNEFSLTSSRPTGGEKCTGVGLFICRQIITLHKGQIGMSNRPEGGACFYFTLPL